MGAAGFEPLSYHRWTATTSGIPRPQPQFRLRASTSGVDVRDLMDVLARAHPRQPHLENGEALSEEEKVEVE